MFRAGPRFVKAYLKRRAALATRRRGDDARDRRHWEEAANAYRHFLATYPDDPAIWIQLGHMLGELLDFEGAEAAYARADALRANDPDLALCRGHLAVRKGDMSAAQAFYERSLWLDNNIHAQTALAAIVPPAPAIEVMAEEPTVEQATGAEGDADPEVTSEETARFDIPPPPGRLEGWIAGGIFGFATGEPGDAPVVEFRVDGRSIGVATARLSRENAREHGFKALLDLDSEGLWVAAHRMPGGEELEQSPVFIHPRAPRAGAGPITASSARAVVVKPFAPAPGAEIALFVTHAPLGRLKPHVAPYLVALKAAGIATLLIAVADRSMVLPPELLDMVSGAIVRENAGYDFAAWSHALEIYPDIYGAGLLLLLNDSVVVSVVGERFTALIDRVRKSQGDLTALTESHEYGWHVQSYFMGCKPRMLSSWAFHAFMRDVQLLEFKDDVIRAYEVPFASTMEGAGLSIEVLYPSERAINPTLFGWRDLLAAGFPFVKLLLLRGAFPEVDITDWREVLGTAGFDIAVIEHSLAAAAEQAPSNGDSRLLARTVRYPAETPAPPPKVAFFGPWNYDNGLGEASRNLICALRRTSAQLNLHPIKKPFHVHRPHSPPVEILDFTDTPDVAIIHLNPDSWHLLTEAQLAIIRSAGRRIGYWVWEMDLIPEAWHQQFGAVDRIWSPSRYCAETFAREATVPIDIVPHPIPRPHSTSGADRTAMLDELGLATSQRVILYVFDGSSYLVRKNPSALVRAFAASQLAEQGWTLVLKTKHLFDRQDDGAALSDLVAATAGVRLIDRRLDANILSALLAFADIYASPHCSEGFGLTIAEAMAAGKPVVATDFSGNRDYLDSSCGFPVRAHEWKLSEDFGHYTAGGTWARIDEPALTQALRAAALTVAAGDDRIGVVARARIAERLSFSAVAETIERSLAETMAAAPAHGELVRFESTVSNGVPFDEADCGTAIRCVPLARNGALHAAGPDSLDGPDSLHGPEAWIAFAPRDSLLSPAFTTDVMNAVRARPDVAIFYGDDVAIGAPRAIDQLRIKPEWDLTLLVAQDFVGWPVIVSRSALVALGGLDPKHGSAVLMDFVLRAHLAGFSIARIPQILLAYRGDRPHALVEDRRRLLTLLPAFAQYRIVDGRAAGLLALSRRFSITDMPPVDLIIPTRRSKPIDDETTYIERLLGSLAETDWPMDRLTVIVGDDIERPADWAGKSWPFKLRRIATPRANDARFNYAGKMNGLWREAEAEQIVFLNDDVLPQTSGWLKALQTFALDASVGGVGARLLYPDKRLQHAGIAPLFAAVAHAWLGRRPVGGTYQNWALSQREWSMVTGAVFATRRSLMERIGGFDERFSLEFNDIDLCLRLRTLGLRIVYTPEAELIHAEKASRGEALPPGEEIARFLTRWAPWLNADPSFHPGFRRDRFDLAPYVDPSGWFR